MNYKLKMKILEEIQEMLSYYKSNYKNLEINNLLDFQDKLSINSYFLAEEVAKIKAEYNFDYYNRKIEFSKSKQGFINQSKKNYEADNLASIETQQLLNTEVEFESVGFRLELLLKQVNKILSAVNQRISYLKFEKNQTNIQNQT